jgi:hypothetical protein
MSRVVTSAAFGSPMFLDLLDRLESSLAAQHVAYILHRQDPIFHDWPTHQVSPYSFKAAAVQYAIDKGYTSVCWLDSPCIVRKHLSPLWDIADKEGAVIFRDGWRNDEWCTDECFTLCGTPKEEYAASTHVLAGCFILNLTHPRTRMFWGEYRALARDGAAFRGPTVIDKDRKTKPYGHRHDQSVMSLLAAKHGIPLTDVTGFINYDEYKGGIVHIARA